MKTHLFVWSQIDQILPPQNYLLIYSGFRFIEESVIRSVIYKNKLTLVETGGIVSVQILLANV